MAATVPVDDEDVVEMQVVGDDDGGNMLQSANDPFGDDDEAPAGAAVNDPFANDRGGGARVVAPTAAVGDEDDDSCGVCFDEPGEGERVSLLCCRNKLCLTCSQRIGACPFCRSEPLMWGLR